MMLVSTMTGIWMRAWLSAVKSASALELLALIATSRGRPPSKPSTEGVKVVLRAMWDPPPAMGFPRSHLKTWLCKDVRYGHSLSLYFTQEGRKGWAKGGLTPHVWNNGNKCGDEKITIKVCVDCS